MVRKIMRRIKRKLKPGLTRARTKYIRWRHVFDTDDFISLLIELGIEEGDLLLVHSSLSGFEGYKDKLPNVIEALQKVVGLNGTILMPTQPFRGNAVNFAKSGVKTDVIKTPSKMGLITEIFRRCPGVIRSVHPTHPVAAWGCDAKEITREHYLSKTPCGRDTPYARFGEKNGKILLLSTGINVFTYYHSIEEYIEPLLPFSPFTEETFELFTITENGETVRTLNRLFDPEMSTRRDMRHIIPYLKSDGIWREKKVGTLSAIMLTANELRNVIDMMLKKNQYCYNL